jgi:hypothetical protein
LSSRFPSDVAVTHAGFSLAEADARHPAIRHGFAGLPS